MIKLGVVFFALNQPEMTQEMFDTLRAGQEGDTDLLIIDNGSNPPLRSWLKGLREGDAVIRNEINVGVMPAMNQAYAFFKNHVDYIFFTHNDVFVYEKGWDTKIKRILSTVPNVGCAGFYGAKGLGAPGLYDGPYIMGNLARFENVSNCNRMDAAVHGFRNIAQGRETEQVATLDGFSLIVNVDLLNKTDGFDRKYPVHHNYDNDICLESLDKGYDNIVIAMDAKHIGGQTDVKENWNAPFGKSKQQIHIDAHPVMYEKWSPKNVTNGLHKISLPVRVTKI
jgi:GT2 family glycosyltransferase